jgi:hypothetical protein
MARLTKKSHVTWCWKQKRGIKMEEIIENSTLENYGRTVKCPAEL